MRAGSLYVHELMNFNFIADPRDAKNCTIRKKIKHKSLMDTLLNMVSNFYSIVFVRFLVARFGTQNKSMNVNFDGIVLYSGFRVKMSRKMPSTASSVRKSICGCPNVPS